MNDQLRSLPDPQFLMEPRAPAAFTPSTPRGMLTAARAMSGTSTHRAPTARNGQRLRAVPGVRDGENHPLARRRTCLWPRPGYGGNSRPPRLAPLSAHQARDAVERLARNVGGTTKAC